MWRVEDHTADVQLAVEAESWDELLQEAARAFAGFLSPGAPGRASIERSLEVQGADAAETWVHWWKALHRLWAVEGLLPVTAAVEPGASAALVRAKVGCVPADSLDPAACADVKAVTWHGAEAGLAKDGRWLGRIVLDV